MKRIITFAILIALMTTSCGTIFLGTKQDISITSEPSECKVYVDGADYTTPVVVKLSRGKEHTIRFEKSGYEPHTVTLGKHVGVGTLIANILLTGVIGIVVDFVDGAAYGLDEKEVFGRLEEESLSLNLPTISEDEYHAILIDQAEIDAYLAAKSE